MPACQSTDKTWVSARISSGQWAVGEQRWMKGFTSVTSWPGDWGTAAREQVQWYTCICPLCSSVLRPTPSRPRADGGGGWVYANLHLLLALPYQILFAGHILGCRGRCRNWVFLPARLVPACHIHTPTYLPTHHPPPTRRAPPAQKASPQHKCQ